MGTEMRIGIAAGLVIVVATGAYFIYGSDRSDGDLLLTPEKIASVSTTDSKKPATATKTSNSSSLTGKSAPTRDLTASGAKSRNAAAPTRTRNVNSPAVVTRTSHGTSANGAMANQGNLPANPARPVVMGNKPGTTPRTTGTQASPLVLSKPTATTSTIQQNAARVPPARMPADRATEPTNKRPDVSKADPTPALVLNSDIESTIKTATKSTTDTVPAADAKTDDRPIRVAMRSTQPVIQPNAGQNAENRTKPVVMPAAASEPVAARVETWPKRHTIESGDTLSDISMKYYGTSRLAGEIVIANPDIKGPRSLRIGRELVIPEPGKSAPSSIVRLASDREDSATRRSTPPRRTASPVVVAPARKYTVQKGDTFYSIARDVCGSPARWKELFEANKSVVSSPAKLRPGMVLKIPA